MVNPAGSVVMWYWFVSGIGLLVPLHAAQAGLLCGICWGVVFVGVWYLLGCGICWGVAT